MKNRATKHGYVGEWRCVGVKTRGEPCSAGICTKFGMVPGDTSHELYRLPNPHDHETSLNKVTALTDAAKELIAKMVDDKKKCGPIMDELRKQTGIGQPKKNQVENFIKYYRQKKYGEAKVTVQQFLEFAQKHTDIPADEDEAFCIGFDHSALDGDGENENDPEPWIRMIVSTKRLLANSAGSTIVHADGTYKLNIQRWPVLVFGTSDMDSTQHFHLIALMLCKTETEDDFAFGFDSIKKAMNTVHNRSFEPKRLMADAAEAIQMDSEKFMVTIKTF